MLLHAAGEKDGALGIGFNDGSWQGIGYTCLIVAAVAGVILLGRWFLGEWLPRWISRHPKS